MDHYTEAINSTLRSVKSQVSSHVKSIDFSRVKERLRQMPAQAKLFLNARLAQLYKWSSDGAAQADDSSSSYSSSSTSSPSPTRHHHRSYPKQKPSFQKPNKVVHRKADEIDSDISDSVYNGSVLDDSISISTCVPPPLPPPPPPPPTYQSNKVNSSSKKGEIKQAPPARPVRQTIQQIREEEEDYEDDGDEYEYNGDEYSNQRDAVNDFKAGYQDGAEVMNGEYEYGDVNVNRMDQEEESDESGDENTIHSPPSSAKFNHHHHNHSNESKRTSSK
jgi:hypothetical protein